MWEEIFSTAISNGIFAALFVCLLIYELKDSRKRESKYQNTIEILSSKLETVEEIKQDVSKIKESILKYPVKKRKNYEND